MFLKTTTLTVSWPTRNITYITSANALYKKKAAITKVLQQARKCTSY